MDKWAMVRSGLGLLGAVVSALGCGETSRDFENPGAGGQSSSNVTGAGGALGGDTDDNGTSELAENGAACGTASKCYLR